MPAYSKLDGPRLHAGNSCEFADAHPSHRLFARNLYQGVLLAEGTFLFALRMDHRRECFEHQRLGGLQHVIPRDNADVCYGALATCHSNFTVSI